MKKYSLPPEYRKDEPLYKPMPSEYRKDEPLHLPMPSEYKDENEINLFGNDLEELKNYLDTIKMRYRAKL